MNVAFWNINGNDLRPQIRGLVEENRTDLLVLIENELPPIDVLRALNAEGVEFFYCSSPLGVCERIHVFTRFSADLVPVVKENGRCSARRLILPDLGRELLIIALHYQSKSGWSDSNQSAHAATLRNFIEAAEELVGHEDTIVIGDFNMNPFEYGMVQTTGLHAVMDRQVALEGTRVVDGEPYKFFYNPMWSFFGEQGKGDVNGSYFYRKAEPICYFWNIFDQVIVRPGILGFLDEHSLRIVTHIQGVPLTNDRGIVDKRISDHLPVAFSLRF